MSIDYDQYKNGGLLKDRYVKVEDISEGAYGIVSLAEDRHNERKLVAVKYITQFTDNTKNGDKVVTPLKANEVDVSHSGSEKINNRNDRSVILQEAKQEIDILTKLGSHPHITQLYDSFDSYLVLEYCSRGDLYEIIRSNCGPTSTKDIIDVMSQLIDAVSYAHSLGIYHRDIKPENILITDDWSVKLTDWGLATDKKLCTDFDVGSERYMSPELFDAKNIESYEADKCDIWSLGICLLNIVFGKNPFSVANQSDKLFVHFAANRETIFDIFPTMSYELFGILRYSLTIDPDNRDLENMKQEMSKARHLTLDYDLESYVSETEGHKLQGSEERSKSNPVVTNSPERRFVRGNRKPLAIPSRRYKDSNNLNGKNSNNYNNNYTGNNNNSYNRQDFFTPRSVFNNYMDKIDKNHNDLKDLDSTNRDGLRNGHHKKRIPNNNRRAWRKGYKKQPLRNHLNDGVFLKPNSIKKFSPPSSSQDAKNRRKRYSTNSYSSSAGKYVPPSLRSPNIEAQMKTDDEAIEDIEFDVDVDVDDDDDDDDDEVFMLEEYQNSPRDGDKKSKRNFNNNNDLSFAYPNFKSTKVGNNPGKLPGLLNFTNTPTMSNSLMTPLTLAPSSSNGYNQNKYVPPHHRRNSHSAVSNNRVRHQLQKSKRSSFLAIADFEPSSVPLSWSMKSDKLNKVNQKFNKNYTQGEFNVNDMYHTFAKLRLQSHQDHDGKNLDVFASSSDVDDDDDDYEAGTDNNDGNESGFRSLKDKEFNFTSRAIPSYTS